MRKLTAKEAASLCTILGTLAAGCVHAATQCRVDPTLNGCRLQTVVITNKVPGSITIPNQPTPTIYVPPGVIGVVGGFTPPNVTANGGTIGTYSSSTNSHCPQSGGKPAIDTAGIQSYIQQQEYRVWRKVMQLLWESVFSLLHSFERRIRPACRTAAALVLRITMITPKAIIAASCDTVMIAARGFTLEVRRGSLA